MGTNNLRPLADGGRFSVSKETENRPLSVGFWDIHRIPSAAMYSSSVCCWAATSRALAAIASPASSLRSASVIALNSRRYSFP